MARRRGSAPTQASEEELEACRGVLRKLREYLAEGNFEGILDEIYRQDEESRTRTELLEILKANKEDYYPMIDHCLSSNSTLKFFNSICIRFTESLDNFPSDDCIVFYEDLKIAPLGNSERLNQDIFKDSPLTKNIFKTIISLESASDNPEPRKLEDYYMCMYNVGEWFEDYYKSSLYRYIIYHESKEWFVSIESWFTQAKDFGMAIKKAEIFPVSEAEWEDAKKRLELFEYSPEDE